MNDSRRGRDLISELWFSLIKKQTVEVLKSKCILVQFSLHLWYEIITATSLHCTSQTRLFCLWGLDSQLPLLMLTLLIHKHTFNDLLFPRVAYNNCQERLMTQAFNQMWMAVCLTIKLALFLCFSHCQQIKNVSQIYIVVSQVCHHADSTCLQPGQLIL